MGEEILRPVKIVTDACAAIPAKMVEEYAIACISFSIFCKGSENEMGIGLSKEEQEYIYNSLREGERLYTLSATEYNIRNTFKKELESGYDILYIACPKVLSKTISKARLVAEELLVEYEDTRIEIIDAHNPSAGEGILVLEAAKMVKDGKNLDEIIPLIKNMRSKIVQYVALDCTEYLSRANTIRASKAFVGDLLNIKPILTSAEDGEQIFAARVKGREESLAEVVKLFLNKAKGLENKTIYIGHSDDEDSAEVLADMLDAKNVQCKRIVNFCFGGPYGISIGPGAAGLFALSE